MPAEIYRVASGEVHAVGTILFEDAGALRHAVQDTHGNYSFSEAGAGVQPLAIIGTEVGVKNFFITHSSAKLVSTVPENLTMYMSVEAYRPTPRYETLNPVGDSTNAVAAAAASFAPGNMFTEIAGAIGDSVSSLKKLFVEEKKPKKKRAAAPLKYCIGLHYLPGDRMERIGSASIEFYPDLYSAVCVAIHRRNGGAVAAVERRKGKGAGV
jgi:hypothetical protein